MELQKQVDELRAELARLQCNEDCVRRLIAWATENGWNGVDNSKILDVFISGLVDQLRAELAAAKDQIASLENQKAAAEYAVAEIWNKNGPHPKLGWMPSGILQGMVERGEQIVKERDQLRFDLENKQHDAYQYANMLEVAEYQRDQLAAHIERLGKALKPFADRIKQYPPWMWTAMVEREKQGIVTGGFRVGGEAVTHMPAMLLVQAEEALAATPKQSLAAIKVKTLREVAAKLETEAFARSDGSFHDAAVFVEQEAEKIEKEEA